MKIKGTCGNCGREFFVQQLNEAHGHCPWCSRPFNRDYTAVLVENLELAEAAGNNLESALEKIAGTHPNFVLDEESVLSVIEQHLDEVRRGKPRPR